MINSFLESLEPVVSDSESSDTEERRVGILQIAVIYIHCVCIIINILNLLILLQFSFFFIKFSLFNSAPSTTRRIGVARV